jgi:hypothetical protein
MPFDGTQLSPVTQALIVGRDRIEAGWCQNRMLVRKYVWPRGFEVSVCMLAAGGDPEILLSAVADLGFTARSLPEFNDAPERTKGDVLAVYNRAIEISFA